MPARRRPVSVAPPPSLPAAAAERLQELVDATVRAQRRQGLEARERALALVPRLLRGPVRKVVGG